ncbi:449_t:CDS:2 [Racocetra fulgida]|uniref:449_t:CDS:1 n=1 Tax=Racocetra fulgida TaxID=60492 RepID=A0A9N8VFE6_9GLOM|nr:449_t:CDS:2 [Racocetra fulgida]
MTLTPSQITNFQGFITRPGGPKRQVKSPLEKVTESLPEIEENQAIDEQLNAIEISTDNAKVIGKDESLDKENTNLEFYRTNTNIEHMRNIKSTFDEKQKWRPQDVQTIDQTPILSDNLDNTPTSEYYNQYSDDLSNMNRESYLERLQEQDFKIAEFKKRELWFKSQLELAKKNGYSPDSFDNDLNDETDVENLSDSEEIGSEKFTVIRFIVQLTNIEPKVEKTSNLLDDVQAIKEQLLQIKIQLKATRQGVVKPDNIEKDCSSKKVSECCESEESRPSKEISECYSEPEMFYEIAEIEDMIRLVESKAARIQRQIKEIKQKANQIGSDHQMINMYAQSADKLMKMIKDQLISKDKEGLEEKLKKTINTHGNVRTSILQDYEDQQPLSQQLNIFKREKLRQISHMQTQVTQIQNEKDLLNREYEELKGMYDPLKNENEMLKRSNELLRQQILTYENMKENLEQKIEQKKSSFEQESLNKGTKSEEQQWEEERTLKESEINLYREKNNKLIVTNEELEQKLINSENKVAMLLDQMESIVEVYRSIGDVFGIHNNEELSTSIHNNEELSTINFEIQEPKASESRDDYFDNLVKEKYPDLPNFVLPEYPSSPTGTELSETVSFDENDSDIDIGKSSDQIHTL